MNEIVDEKEVEEKRKKEEQTGGEGSNTEEINE